MCVLLTSVNEFLFAVVLFGRLRVFNTTHSAESKCEHLSSVVVNIVFTKRKYL